MITVEKRPLDRHSLPPAASSMTSRTRLCAIASMGISLRMTATLPPRASIILNQIAPRRSAYLRAIRVRVLILLFPRNSLINSIDFLERIKLPLLKLQRRM